MKFVMVSMLILMSVATLGCEKARQTTVGIVPAETGRAYSPVKSIWLIDYPEGGKDEYLAWIASVSPTLVAPPEVLRIRSYDNIDEQMSPNRLVEFEFNSFVDGVSYMNRPEIVEILEEFPNRTNNAEIHTFIQRSDYARETQGEWTVMKMYLINYPVGGKQAYLNWVASISETLVEPEYVKAISSYDNYYGATPNRLVQFEFASEEDAEAYSELEGIKDLDAEFDARAQSWVFYEFALRSDYIKE